MTTSQQLRKAAQLDRPGRGINGAPFMLVLLVLALGGLAVSMEFATYNVWGAFWIGPALLLLCIPIASHAARVTQDVAFGRLVMAAAFFKVIAGSAARYWVDFSLYGGSDASGYHDAGVVLAPQIRRLIYDDLGKISATRFTEILTGHVYAVIGPSRLGGFMVFSWMAFVGVYLFWRAFSIAVPNGDHRRYALLIFFFPTMLLWTSGTGKDAFMMLCLGAAGLGLAEVSVGRIRGIPPLALGLWGAAVVRPHLVLIFLVAAVASAPVNLLRRRLSGRGKKVGPQLILVLVLALVTVLAVDRAEAFFKIDELNVESAESVTETVQGNTSRSGSVYDTQNPTTPSGYLKAAVTVFFRPFPFEVNSAAGLVSASEGLLLALLVCLSLPRIRALPRAMVSTPYVTWAVGYTAAFVFAFASIANFGILARQRAQVLPAVFVLLSLPRPDRDGKAVATMTESEREPLG